MLNLYPSSAKLNYKQSNKEGFTVFKNGERLQTPEDPFTSKNALWDKFVAPVYRIPGMVITDTGRIIVSADYRSTPTDQVAILPAVAYSDDNGRTWKRKIIETNPTHFNGYYRIMDSTMFYYKGVVHIISGKWNGTANNVNWTRTPNDATWSVNHYYSKDNGETWTLQQNFQQTLNPNITAGRSWLGGVGNAIITKYGTCLVPIQQAPSRGTVESGFIYSNDGINWGYAHGLYKSGVSENSLTYWVDSSGRAEITMVGRRDPNNPQNKWAGYFYQTGATTFSTSITDFPTYNTKIPARGSSGCQGSAIQPSTKDGVLTPRPNMLVSYANNFFNNYNAYIRDHIVIAMFSRDNVGDSFPLKEIEQINLSPGSFVDGTPFGGYSMLNYNANCNKLGIAYEDNLGIKYKDLSHLIPIWLYKGVA